MQPEMFVPPPGHALRPYVAAIFRMRARGTFARELVLPAAAVDVLFCLGDALHVSGAAYGGATIELTTSRVAGARTGPIVSRPAGVVDLVGVSLKVESCAELLPVPLHELANASVDGDAVLPELARLRGRLGEAATFHEQCALLVRWLLHRRRPDRRSEAMRWACRELRRPTGDGGLARAAGGLGVSPRHLRRLFDERVGLGPSTYVRLRRFSDALPLIGHARTLAEVAHAVGYFDQPHFCREFRLLAGITPQEYLRGRGPVPGNVYSS